MNNITGVVLRYESGYFAVSCADAPPHLQVLYLEPWAVRSAKVGDRVTLAYRTTASSGFWVVTDVEVTR